MLLFDAFNFQWSWYWISLKSIMLSKRHKCWTVMFKSVRVQFWQYIYIAEHQKVVWQKINDVTWLPSVLSVCACVCVCVCVHTFFITWVSAELLLITVSANYQDWFLPMGCCLFGGSHHRQHCSLYWLLCRDRLRMEVHIYTEMYPVDHCS